jgi:cullin 3
LKLCNPKTMVLSKQEKKPKFDNPEEKITLNEKFENSNIKLMMVPQPNAKKMAQGAGGAKSQNDIDSEVQKERGMIIDAVIVRTMKARKVESHNELVTTVIS